MRVTIVQDKAKEVTYVSINEKQTAFPEPCYHKLCDLFRRLDAKELSYQEAPPIKKSHWVMTNFDDTTKELQSENKGLQLENQALKQSLDSTNRRYTQTRNELEKAMTALNAPWWRRIWKRTISFS